MEKTRIASIVVTYNRKNLLLKNLKALINQTESLDSIIIVDNLSTDGTPQLLYENNLIKYLPTEFPEVDEMQSKLILSDSNNPIEICYYRRKVNDGGSGGFYFGMNEGVKKGFDWLWIMDDDAIPEENSLEELKKYLNVKVSGLCSTVIDSNGNIDIKHRSYILKKRLKINTIPIPLEKYEKDRIIEIEIASYVGFLINTKAIAKVGLPKYNFFIFYDDTEHSLRLQKYGPILLIPSSRIIHLAPVVKSASMSDNWKIYYQYRNRLKTISDHFGIKYLLIFKIEIIIKIIISFVLRKRAYSNMLRKALADYKKI